MRNGKDVHFSQEPPLLLRDETAHYIEQNAVAAIAQIGIADLEEETNIKILRIYRQIVRGLSEQQNFTREGAKEDEGAKWFLAEGGFGAVE